MITVLMSVYNGEKFIEESIISIQNQTYKDFTFLIVDDGSTDNTQEIIKFFQKNDDRIILIARENRGVITSLNEGLRLVKTKYLARIDADDISPPERLENQLKYMEDNKLDISGGHWINIDQDGKMLHLNLAPLNQDSFLIYLAHTVPFAHSTVMFNMDFIRKHDIQYGKTANTFCEDYALELDFYENNARFGNLDQILLKYRVYESSYSSLNFKKNRADAKKLSEFFIRKNSIKIKRCVENLLNSNLSYREEELLVMTSFKLCKITKDFRYILKTLRKCRKRNIPHCICKAIYVTFFE